MKPLPNHDPDEMKKGRPSGEGPPVSESKVPQNVDQTEDVNQAIPSTVNFLLNLCVFKNSRRFNLVSFLLLGV